MLWRYQLAFQLACCSLAFGSETSLTADAIMRKTIAQAQSNTQARITREYTYQKSTLTEVLDGSGEVKERKEKLYLIQGGRAFLQQLRCNGKLASPDALQKEERFTKQAREEVTESKTSQRDETWEKFLTDELTARYEFTLTGEEIVDQRPVYVLTFLPKPGELPVRKMADRVLNRLAGKIWVDQQEFEIAKAELALQSQATLGGILKVVGALKRCEYSIERVRVAPNIWFNRTTRGNFHSRKLWDNSHIRTRTESFGFQKYQSAQR